MSSQRPRYLQQVADEPFDLSESMNGLGEGWVHAMGVRFLEATGERVRCEFTPGPEHLQGYGIVHGGVHCGVIETMASVGAAAYAMPRGQAVVGLENNTSFIRAVRAGTPLTGESTPVTRGRRSQVWEGWIRDPEGRLVATGRVRLLCFAADEGIAGGAAEVQRPET